MFITSGQPAFPQSQALNGQIEGRVLDPNNAAVANAVITVTNIETGAVRTLATDESGVYRFPLLPLGTFRITAEAVSFRKLVREGITLTTGQTATVDMHLPAGDLKETVLVTGDSSIADAGKIDLGRIMNTRDVKGLPLISANPYNFSFFQANVSGRPARGFPFTTINANGYLRRVNFQIDGNANTQGDRATLRFMMMSDTYVNEVQLVANGFAAEFGNTAGLIMNIVTPSGTNDLRGSLRYRFRRPSFYSRPFFYSARDLPDNRSDNFSATVGGPIVRDRWHFYLGFENGARDDKAAPMRLVTISESNRSSLIATGLSPSIFPAAIPSVELGPFYIFRSDSQLGENNRLTVRTNYSDLLAKNQITGGINTLERATDAIVINYGLAAQLTSYTSQLLNEFRFQYSSRRGTSNNGKRNEFSGSSPAVSIPSIANFGTMASPSTDLPVFRMNQLQDNVTRTNGVHVIKFGAGITLYDQTIRSDIFANYTFATIQRYDDAKRGVNPKGYVNYTESFGEPEFRYKAAFWNAFVQDDWKISRSLKLNIGLRYDLYLIPTADPGSLFPASQKFNVDENNFAPRVGVVYSLRDGDHPTVVRASAGLYYDQPLLAHYQRALQNNGNPKFFNITFLPGASNAPNFPNTFSGTLPPGSILPQQNIDTIAPDFVNMYAIHANVQIEQALARDLSVLAGYVHSSGRHIPVYRNINPINPVSFLADGRGVFSQSINAATRLDPRFNIIQMVESVGNLQYNALTLQLNQRFSRGLQFSANYTLSKSTDDAPEQNMTTGNIQGLVLSDRNNRQLDRGYSFADQRQTFVMTLVASPQFAVPHKALNYLLNHNQFGIIAIANSGERFNIVSNLDLNRDGIFGGATTNSDRPVGITRNAGKTPPQYNLDLRYSRSIKFTERYRLEVFGELQNVFNTNSIVQFNNVTANTNASGALIAGLPDFNIPGNSTSQESRQFQLGIKFNF